MAVKRATARMIVKRRAPAKKAAKRAPARKAAKRTIRKIVKRVAREESRQADHQAGPGTQGHQAPDDEEDRRKGNTTSDNGYGILQADAHPAAPDQTGLESAPWPDLRRCRCRVEEALGIPGQPALDQSRWRRRWCGNADGTRPSPRASGTFPRERDRSALPFVGQSVPADLRAR